MRSRRARKSVEQWSKLVDQFDSSTDSMEQFCQQQDLAMSTFQRWRSTLELSKDLRVDENAYSGEREHLYRRNVNTYFRTH